MDLGSLTPDVSFLFISFFAFLAFVVLFPLSYQTIHLYFFYRHPSAGTIAQIWNDYDENDASDDDDSDNNNSYNNNNNNVLMITLLKYDCHYYYYYQQQ